jgi:hypothetical protein
MSPIRIHHPHSREQSPMCVPFHPSEPTTFKKEVAAVGSQMVAEVVERPWKEAEVEAHPLEEEVELHHTGA